MAFSREFVTRKCDTNLATKTYDKKEWYERDINNKDYFGGLFSEYYYSKRGILIKISPFVCNANRVAVNV